MGLRCSLLGHDFGDVVTERERDERGSEIVVTVTELRECRRCDAESIVSENTEVRRRRPAEGRTEGPASTGPEAVSGGDDGPDRLVEEAEASAVERDDTDDAIIIDDAPAATADDPEAEVQDGPTTDDATGTGTPAPDADVGEDEELQPTDSGQTADGATDSEQSVDPRRDSAQTADGTPEGTEAPGGSNEDLGSRDEWPADGTESEPREEESADRGSWPNDPGSHTAGESDVADARDASTHSSAEESRTDSSFEFGESPAETEAAASEDSASEPRSGIKSAGPIDLTGPSDGSLDGILHCPACGYSVALARSSNRAGDICPDCHAGYLAEES